MPSFPLPFFYCLVLILGAALVSSNESFAYGMEIDSLSFRSRVSEKTTLGKDAPEDFKSYDFSAFSFLPYEKELGTSLKVQSRLMASAGLLRGVKKNALVLSLVPEGVIATKNEGFTLHGGIGAALFSRYEFGRQDYGGPFQFALTAGIALPRFHRWGLGYRFMHYSDAGLNGPNTTGADFHMIELDYKL